MSSSAVAPTGGPFAGHALLVSSDLTVIRQITDGLRQFAFNPEICSDRVAAATLVCTRKFQAIVLDVASPEELSRVMELIRCSPSNQTSVTFAVTDLGARVESRVHPNFMMQKPLTTSLIESTLKAAMGLIIRDLRRYFRCPVKAHATLQLADQVRIDCELINISEGGMAVNTSVPLHSGVLVKARFMLPDTTDTFDVEGEVCWSDKRGRAGLHFRSLSQTQRERLQSWLSNKIEQGLPDPVSRFFS